MRLSGVYLKFGASLDRAQNTALHALTRKLLAQPLEGITDIVPGYCTLYLEYDTHKLNKEKVLRWAESAVENGGEAASPRRVTVPVRYDGIDLKDIATRTGLTVNEVIERHRRPSYQVYALGFTPGFAFMGEVDERLRLGRRPTPRDRVPAHSVAMANEQTGIYPLASPGGWNLLGTALVPLFDPHRDDPFFLHPGDEVRFVPEQGETPPEPEVLELLPEAPLTPFFKVRKAGLLDLVVDQGRFRVGRYGLGRCGPLDAPLARLANSLVANAQAAPLLELTLTGPVLEVVAEGVIVLTGWSLQPLVNGEARDPFTSFRVRRGDVISFAPTQRGCRSYLALAGGIEARTFMGSASVDLKGKIGRPLVSGDLLGRAAPQKVRPGRRFVPYRRERQPEVLRLMPGPQATSDALASLAASTFTVGSADRMGLRLEGATVPGGDVLSEATPLGAVQVTSGGTPIILLHDRGTLGGYAKPALLHPIDLPRAAQLRPGSKVQFRLWDDFET